MSNLTTSEHDPAKSGRKVVAFHGGTKVCSRQLGGSSLSEENIFKGIEKFDYSEF